MRLGGWAAGVSKAVNQRRSWWQERGIFVTAVLAQVTTPPALSGTKVEVLHLILVGVDVFQEAGEAPTVPGLTKDG